jgi:hypothetical protein
MNGVIFCANSPLVTTTPLCPFGVDPVTLTCFVPAPVVGSQTFLVGNP